MIRQVDRRGAHVVLKVVTPKGKVLGYLAGLQDGDAGLLRQFKTLAEARRDVGIEREGQ